MVIEKFNRSESAQKKIMQVGIDIKCMHTSFGGHGLSPVLEILLPSKMAKFPFRGMDYSPWSSKNLNDRNRLKKIMQVGDQYQVHAHQFWLGVVSPVSEILLPFKKWPNFPFGAWTIGIGSKNSRK